MAQIMYTLSLINYGVKKSILIISLDVILVIDFRVGMVIRMA